MNRAMCTAAAVALLVVSVSVVGCSKRNAQGPRGEAKPTFVTGGTGQAAKAGPAAKAVAPGGPSDAGGKAASR
jgi:hypothetical protein